MLVVVNSISAVVYDRGRMPTLSPMEQTVLHISNSTVTTLLAYQHAGTKYPLPIAGLVKQATSDRFDLAAHHLRMGDLFLSGGNFRSSISRHYYAMYHAARAATFGDICGDDHQRHSDLPRNLPSALPNRTNLESQLTDARLLRNQADYDPYPIVDSSWETDARALGAVAGAFVQACEDFALNQGLI